MCSLTSASWSRVCSHSTVAHVSLAEECDNRSEGNRNVSGSAVGGLEAHACHNNNSDQLSDQPGPCRASLHPSGMVQARAEMAAKFDRAARDSSRLLLRRYFNIPSVCSLACERESFQLRPDTQHSAYLPVRRRRLPSTALKNSIDSPQWLPPVLGLQ